MAAQKINVGVIGFGMSSQTFHCPLIVSSPYLVLHSIVSSNDSCTKVYPQAKHVKTSDELFASKDVQLVVITTPNGLHFPLAKQSMESGKHVIVEKPFTVTSQEAAELVEISKRTGLVCSIYQNRRWDGDFLTAKHIVENGQLGRLVEFESHFDRFRNFVKAGWRETDDAPGSGMLYDLGAHLIDQALHLFGKPYSVYAVVDNQRHLKETNIDDDFTIIFRYKNGLKVLLRSSMLARQTPVLRFSLRGMDGSYVKHYLDPQEDQLKAGQTPMNAGFGVEREEQWGTINADVKGIHVVGKVETLPGKYLDFYNNVAETILKGDLSHLAVKPEQGYECIRMIETIRQSSEEGGKTIIL
jgi:scyllo-inositol 2-dehydrogenase (NADP+)